MKLSLNRHTIEISHPGKVLFPADGITKADLVNYYVEVAPTMLRHVRDRPVSMLSYPAGIEGRGHFTKEVPSHFPAWIDRVTVPKKGGTVNHLLANDAATLAYLAGQNCITPHVWPARADELRQPDRLIIDLDPSTDQSFADIRATARELGEVYEEAGLAPFAMVTGSRGIHVVAPLRRRGHDFGEVREAALAIAQRLVAEHPDTLTLEALKKNRGDRIYVDVNRNGYAQTAVPPYAVRPRPRAPVAMPLHWEELSDSKLRPDRWTIADAPARLAEDGDPWKGIARRARSLPS